MALNEKTVEPKVMNYRGNISPKQNASTPYDKYFNQQYEQHVNSKYREKQRQSEMVYKIPK